MVSLTELILFKTICTTSIIVGVLSSETCSVLHQCHQKDKSKVKKKNVVSTVSKQKSAKEGIMPILIFEVFQQKGFQKSFIDTVHKIER